MGKALDKRYFDLGWSLKGDVCSVRSSDCLKIVYIKNEERAQKAAGMTKAQAPQSYRLKCLARSLQSNIDPLHTAIGCRTLEPSLVSIIIVLQFPLSQNTACKQTYDIYTVQTDNTTQNLTKKSLKTNVSWPFVLLLLGKLFCSAGQKYNFLKVCEFKYYTLPKRKCEVKI